MSNAKKQLVGLIAIATLLGVETVFTPVSAYATTLRQAPIFLAQAQNVRIATLQCGRYNITIRTIGGVQSERSSYQTKDLYLKNGTRDGEAYTFNNNDYEYKVETYGGGSGKLTVSHYGERVLTQKCTWS